MGNKTSYSISICQIKPSLPREIWRMIFNFLEIRDKLSSSKVIIEFGEFYDNLLRNFEEDSKDFMNHEVERVTRLGLKTQPDDSIDALKLPSISFLIYLCKHSVTWLDGNKSSHQVLTFENDDSNIDYSTYLHVKRACWRNFSIRNIILPTGVYNIFYKVKGPCSCGIDNEYEVTVKHSRDARNNVGYINQQHLKNLSGEWDWAPVYKDASFTELLTVLFNFEMNDELEVLLNKYGDWSRDISFHVIRFALA